MRSESNFLDQIVSYFSPEAGLRRARARYVEKSIRKIRAYDGASSGRRTDGWTTASTSANTEIQGGLIRLRNRSRDLVRNDSYGARAISLIGTNVIGTGIRAQADHARGKIAKNADSLWKAWAGTIACDFEDQHDFYGIQDTVMRCIAESGECLIRRIRTFPDPNMPIPLQIQVLEPDFLDINRASLGNPDNSNFIIQGVEYDKRGKRVAYWLYNRHPGDFSLPHTGGIFSQRVPAEDVIHVFRTDRAGQVRGVPWLAPSILRLRDFNDYEDAQLVRQKIAACFVGFIKDAESDVDGLSPSEEDMRDRFEPGMLENLPPGKDIAFSNPPGAEGYNDYSRNVLRGIAIGTGLTYEDLTGDLSQVNFSSGRMGWLSFQRNVDQWRAKFFIPKVCQGVWKWFIEASVLNGQNIDGTIASWTPPRREMIDPTKEVAAFRDAIRAGQTTISEVSRQNGWDPDELLAEIASDNAKIDKLKLVLDSDPRNVTKAGISQPPPTQPIQGVS